MSPSVTESLVRSNGTASRPQLPHITESHQAYPTSSSNSSDAQCGTDKPEHSLQAAKNRSSSPVGSSRPKLNVLSSCDAPCGCDGPDPTKSPHTDEVSQDTSSHVPETKLDHRKKSASSPSIDSIPTASSGQSEPVKSPPPAATDCQHVDDDHVYNIGQTKIFDQKARSIPKLYEARWQIIRPDIFDRVHKRLGRGRFAVRLNKPKTPTIIELMSAGVAKASSNPAVVVVIPKHIKKMQDFLDTDSTVRNRCKPEDGTTVELLALACKGLSTLVGMPGEPLRKGVEVPSASDSEYVSDDIVSLNSTDDSDSSAELHPSVGVVEFDAQSLCVVREPSNIDGNVRHGMGIRLVTKDGLRYVRGTCGGLLQLRLPDQAPRLVGLMAAHLLEQLFQDIKDEKQKSIDSSSGIGEVLYPKNSRDVTRYDWALFDAAGLGVEPDMTEHDGYTIAHESEFPDVSTVVVIRTARGEVTGTLSSTSSGIMLNPDQGFVNVRTIMIDKGQSISVSSLPFQRRDACYLIQTITHPQIGSIITKGDSGAWVYQEECMKVYGYIIATNGHEHAYMVLLHAAIAEVQASLRAVSVSLAVSTDPGSERRPGTTNERGGQTKRPIPSPNSGRYAGMQYPVKSSLRSSMQTTMHSGRLMAFERRQEAPTANSNDGEPEDMISVTPSQEQFSPMSPMRWASQRHKLAKAHLEKGLVQEAIKILEGVVKVRGDLLGGNHADCLASQHELAVAYIQNRQATEAITLLKHVVAVEGEVLDKSSVERFTSQHELGRAYLADGQVSEAIEILEHVVAVKMSILDESDPQLLASQVVLAEAHLRAGRPADAVNLLEHVITAAAGTSIEHTNLRVHSTQWLSIASSQLDGMGSGGLAGQNSKPLSVFIKPRK